MKFFCSCCFVWHCLALVAALLLGLSSPVCNPPPPVIIYIYIYIHSRPHPRSSPFAFLLGPPSTHGCSACGPVLFLPRHTCLRLRLVLFCTCCPYVQGLWLWLWPMPTWVWREFRSVLFSFQKEEPGGSVWYWQPNCKYKQHLVLHAGLFFVWHYAGHLLQQLQQIPEVAMMIFLVCCRHWLAGCGSFGLIWGCSQVYIRVVLSAFGIPWQCQAQWSHVLCSVMLVIPGHKHTAAVVTKYAMTKFALTKFAGAHDGHKPHTTTTTQEVSQVGGSHNWVMCEP